MRSQLGSIGALDLHSLLLINQPSSVWLGEVSSRIKFAEELRQSSVLWFREVSKYISIVNRKLSGLLFRESIGSAC
jgi:phage anti-repressor protein